MPLLTAEARTKESTQYTANIKQFYGLRKDLNQLQESLDKLCEHIAKNNGGRL